MPCILLILCISSKKLIQYLWLLQNLKSIHKLYLNLHFLDKGWCHTKNILKQYYMHHTTSLSKVWRMLKIFLFFNKFSILHTSLKIFIFFLFGKRKDIWMILFISEERVFHNWLRLHTSLCFRSNSALWA